MSDSEVEAEEPPVRKRRVMRAVMIALLAPVLLAVAAFVFALGRDIPAPDWMVDEIEMRADRLLSGGALELGDVSVNLGRDLHPRIRLTGSTLQDAAGTPIARLPLIEGLFSPRGALFQQEALMQDLRISGAQINLRRDATGAVALSFDGGGAQVESAGSFLDLIDQSDDLFDLPALAALETIRADGLVVNYTDLRAGRAWTVDGGALLLDVRGEATRVEGQLTVLSGGAAPTDVTLAFESPRGSRAASLEVALKDVQARDIAAQSPALSWLADVDAPLTATVQTARDEDGALAPLTATLALGAGALQPNPATKPIAFEGAQVDLTFDPANNVIVFDHVSAKGDLGEINATGQTVLDLGSDELPRSMVGQFSFVDTVLSTEVLPTPVTVPQMQADLQLTLDPFRIDIGQIYTQLPDVTVYSRGHVAALPNGWEVAVDLSVPQTDQATLMQLWPETMMAGPRKWYSNAVSDAQYRDLQVGIRKPADGPVQVAGSVGYHDMGMTYLRTMPPVEAARGTAVFTNAEFAVAMDAGFVTAPDGGPVDMAGSTFLIPDMSKQVRDGVYDLRVSGALPDLTALLDLPPMGYMTKAKLPIDVADGRASVRMDLRHPIKSGIRAPEVSFAARADLWNVSSDGLIPDRQLEASALAVVVDKDSMTVTGAARVDDVRVNGTWLQRFAGPVAGSFDASFQLSEAAMQRFGVQLPPGSVAGEGTGTLKLTVPRGAPPRYEITSDLRGLRVALPAVGWAKAPRTAGRLRVEGRLGAAPQVDRLEIAGGGLDVAGDVTFNADGGLNRARLTRVQIGDWLNAPITLRGRGAGRPFDVAIGGGTIDMRRARFGAGGGESGPLSIALDRLQITEGIALNRFAGEFTSSGGFAGEFTAWINNVGQVRGTVAPRNGRSAVRILSDNAGGVALATGLTRNAVGGTLELTLLPSGGDGTFDGQLAIRGLRFRDAPAMAALLDAISVVGLLQQLDGQGLAFDEVDAAFRLTPTRLIVTEASAVGPGLGISLDGIYTLATQQMDFQGVISPFYLINSIGSVLTRRGEGLIGFNFTLGGSAASPQVNVNPLSAFTPGMFREIFRRSPPEVSQ